MTNQPKDENEHPDLSHIVEKVHEHVDTRLEYLRLIVSEKVAVAMTKTTSLGVILSLFFLFFFFLNVAAAMWIGKHYNDYSIGFAAIAGFYLIAAFIYLLLRKSVFEKKMEDSIVKSLYAENGEDEEDEE